MLCKHCGKNIDQYAKVCLNCNNPTDFLRGLDGKEKLDNLEVVAKLDMVDSPELDSASLGKVACRQCGFLNDASQDECSLCGCALEKPLRTVAGGAAETADTYSAGGRIVTMLSDPAKRKKLIIGAICAAEILFIILVIVIVLLLTGKNKDNKNDNSVVSLNYIETSTDSVYVSEMTGSVVSLPQGAVSSGLDLNSLLNSEEMASMLAAISSNISSQQPNSTPTYIVIPPYGASSAAASVAASSDNSSEPSEPDDPSESTPSIVQSSPPSSKPDSKPSSSKEPSSQPVSSEPSSETETSQGDASSDPDVTVIPTE